MGLPVPPKCWLPIQLRVNRRARPKIKRNITITTAKQNIFGLDTEKQSTTAQAEAGVIIDNVIDNIFCVFMTGVR